MAHYEALREDALYKYMFTIVCFTITLFEYSDLLN